MGSVFYLSGGFLLAAAAAIVPHGFTGFWTVIPRLRFGGVRPRGVQGLETSRDGNGIMTSWLTPVSNMELPPMPSTCGARPPRFPHPAWPPCTICWRRTSARGRAGSFSRQTGGGYIVARGVLRTLLGRYLRVGVHRAVVPLRRPRQAVAGGNPRRPGRAFQPVPFPTGGRCTPSPSAARSASTSSAFVRNRHRGRRRVFLLAGGGGFLDERPGGAAARGLLQLLDGGRRRSSRPTVKGSRWASAGST